MFKKILFLFIITFFMASVMFPEQKKITFIDGSNIYIKIFLFFFPIGKEYGVYFLREDGKLSAEIDVAKQDIINEPISEQNKQKLFDTDLSFSIREIPVGKTGEFELPVVIRANRKMTKKTVKFTVITKENIMVLKGESVMLLGEITDSNNFKNRFTWKYPFFFDIRLQIPELTEKSKPE